jgi:hypothetical protein
MNNRMWMLVLTICVLASTALAGTGRLQFVETDVILYPNGQASEKYGALQGAVRRIPRILFRGPGQCHGLF